MITYVQAIILGLLQGVTELFPISSLGHTVIAPVLLGWHIDESADAFLLFVVATHTATALVLLGFYAREWVLIVRGILGSIAHRKIDTTNPYERLGWLLVVATIPAGILGLLFEKKIQALFAAPVIVGVALVLNGIMLYLAERSIQKNASKQGQKTITSLSWMHAIEVGTLQALALIPGFSRTGASLSGGLLVGLTHEDAVRFSFLLATPIIFAASVLKLPHLITHANEFPIGPIVVGSIVAAVAAYLSVRFLTNYFKTKTLLPFAWYCVGIGAITILVSVGA